MLKSLVLVICVHISVASVNECGKQKIQPKLASSYIVGGVEVKPHSWPWVVAIMEDNMQVCGGSIINENWILTAAHCMKPTDEEQLIGVGLHAWAEARHGHGGETYEFEKVIVHESFNLTGKDMNNDIALIKIKGPIKYSDHVQPICLPEPYLQFEENQEFYVVGWGKLNGTTFDYPKELRQVNVPFIDDDECNSWRYYGRKFNREVAFCAGYEMGGKDSCNGDSGGGIFFKSNDQWVQGGIVSWGLLCAFKHKPGIYTRLPNYISWIEEIMNQG